MRCILGLERSFLGGFAIGGVHQGLRCFARLRRDCRACQHARDFFLSFLVVECDDSGCCAVFCLLFFDAELLLSPGGDLRGVCDDEDLSFVGESSQLSCDGGGGGASDSAIDFVEDERACESCIGEGDADSE